MSNYYGKLYLIFLLILNFILQPIYSQGNTYPLSKADSLFQKQQYPESYAAYKQIFEQQEQYSPQMLLKMAYIQELHQNYTATIYYLHLYYQKKPSRAVLKKMEDLAQRQHYSGYEYSDYEFFKTQFQKYYLIILEFMLTLAVGSLTIMIMVYRSKKKIVSRTLQIVFISYLGFILVYMNFFRFGRKGIIRQSNVAIMAAPAAGATWITTATEGHRIELNGEQDIWYETEWNGQRAFIRKKNVLELP